MWPDEGPEFYREFSEAIKNGDVDAGWRSSEDALRSVEEYKAKRKKIRDRAQAFVEKIKGKDKPSMKESLTAEILEMSISCTTEGSERCVYLGSNEERAREIGRKLYDIGGDRLMFSVCNIRVPLEDRGELSAAWHGIGEWRH